MPGDKYDAGKPRWELLPFKAINEAVKVLTHAAEHKYSAHNWRKGLEQSRLVGAAMRHSVAYLDGEDNDPDTESGGYCHLANAICALAFALENHLDGRTELDDRYVHADRIDVTVEQTGETTVLATDLLTSEKVEAMKRGRDV